MKGITYTLLSVMFLWTACSSDGAGNRSTSGGSSLLSQEDAVEYLGSREPKYSVLAGEVTGDFADATIESWGYEDGRFNFDIGGSSYVPGAQTPDASSVMCANSDEGQHLHVMIGKKPYSAEYSSSFEYPLSDGSHKMLVFLGKSYHESVKHPKAGIARDIEIKDGNLVSEENFTGPALFFSRPKDTYVGEDAERILLDFYPVNIKIGEDAKIKLQVNGEQYYLYEWRPYFIEGLPFGENMIGIQLVDMNGEAISSKINGDYRKIKLVRDPAPREEIN